jgi:hypothetical protein
MPLTIDKLDRLPEIRARLAGDRGDWIERWEMQSVIADETLPIADRQQMEFYYHAAGDMRDLLFVIEQLIKDRDTWKALAVQAADALDNINDFGSAQVDQARHYDQHKHMSIEIAHRVSALARSMINARQAIAKAAEIHEYTKEK